MKNQLQALPHLNKPCLKLLVYNLLKTYSQVNYLKIPIKLKELTILLIIQDCKTLKIFFSSIILAHQHFEAKYPRLPKIGQLHIQSLKFRSLDARQIQNFKIRVLQRTYTFLDNISTWWCKISQKQSSLCLLHYIK